MSAPGNAEKLGTVHSNIQLSVPGWERTYNALVSTPLSQCIIPPSQPGKKVKDVIKWITYT